MANDPPFATLNHFAADLGIPSESDLLRIGITYRSIKNAGAFEAYAKRAVPALQAEGGRFIVRGMPTKIYEAGMNERVVVIEFDDIAKAVAAHDAAEYQTALKLLGDGADRDIRIVEGAA